MNQRYLFFMLQNNGQTPVQEETVIAWPNMQIKLNSTGYMLASGKKINNLWHNWIFK